MNTTALISELTFKAVRSSGAGGQNVNKVASKVELYFDLNNSAALDEAQKELLLKTLKTKLTKEQILILQCEESRSQHKNKAIVIERFLELIKSGLVKPKKRKATKIPKSAIKKRLKAKRDQSDKKAFRKPPPVD
ncbi:alternative ribosome rescue aminoacyl-tRNA hydrolase ArfB [Paucihalobacter sp.]|uniref:alternative ribosome rescue aminoacyl-tRNA hydrolase ArfB n=1 Tax=Paucihalobacter sp. TaxID=2850405 RepID=UPI002FE092EC